MNFNEQYEVPGNVSGGHDRHVVTIQGSIVRANTENSTTPNDLQGNCGNPILFRTACTRHVFDVTIRFFFIRVADLQLVKKENKRAFKCDLKCIKPSFIRKGDLIP